MYYASFFPEKTQNYPLCFLKLLKFSIVFLIDRFLLIDTECIITSASSSYHYPHTSTINFLYQKLIQLRVFTIFKTSDPLNFNLGCYDHHFIMIIQGGRTRWGSMRSFRLITDLLLYLVVHTCHAYFFQI